MSVHILLVQGKSKLSQAIQKRTSSPWSHCAFLINNQTIYEADWKGVVEVPIQLYFWKYQRMVIKGFDDPTQERELVRWCRERLGTPYDYGKLIGFFFWAHFGCTWLGRLLDSKALFTCYEFVWEGMHAVGYALQSDQMTGVPADLLKDPLLEPEATEAEE